MIDEIYLCSNKCRLCLCDEKFQIPIFGEVAQGMQIPLKIKTCLPVQVSQDDKLPKNICYKCVSALEQSFNLWKVSSESEAVLKFLSSSAKQDLPEGNMQHQSFGSSPYRKPSQSNNRRLMLPTGVPIIVESDSEEEEMPQMRTLSPLRETSKEEAHTKCFWDGDTVMMHARADFRESLSKPATGTGNTSPNFLESLLEPSVDIRWHNMFGPAHSANVQTNSSANILESPAKPAPNISDAAPIKTMAQTEEMSPAHNRWRSMSLFGMSANTWRDFYRSGEMFRCQEPRHRTSQDITASNIQCDMPTRRAKTSTPTDSQSYRDVLQAVNKCNCKALSQCHDTPGAHLNFLHTHRPEAYDENAPHQGPK